MQYAVPSRLIAIVLVVLCATTALEAAVAEELPVAAEGYAQTFRMRPSTARWRPRFRVEAEGAAVWQSRNDVAVPGDTGTRFALDDLTGSGPWPGGRLTLDWQIAPRHRIRAMVAPLEFSGTGRLSQPVRFAGETYAAGVPTEGTYKFNSYRLGYHYTFWKSRRWTWRVGAVLKVRDASTELSQGSTASKKDDLGLVPLLHLDATYRLSPRWWITADLDGLGAPQGRAIDFALKLHYRLNRRWDLAVGYRTIEGGADNDTVYTFAWFHQAVLSVGLRF